MVKSLSALLTPTGTGLGAAVLVYAFFAIAINTTEHGWPDWYRMLQAGVEANALVTRTEPARHQTCYFSYSVDGRRYESSDFGCADRGVGNSVSITYLPGDPTFATTHSPREEFLFLVFAPLALALIAGVAAAFRASMSKEGASSN
jgi:hypothetical protein